MGKILSTIYFAFNAIAPILLLILLGYFAKKKKLLNDNFFKSANRFNFRFALSCLMFSNIYSLDNLSEIPLNVAGFLLITLMVITAVGFLAAALFTKVRARKGVLIQATFRSNYAIIGLPIATALGGVAGSALASALQAPTVIYFNFMAVFCMSLYSDGEHSFQWKKVIRSIVTNPLILGLFSGVVVLCIRQFIPVDDSGELVFSIQGSLPWLYSAIKYMAGMATPLALIVLGGQFTFAAVKGMRKELICGIVMRLLVAPIIGFSFAFAARGLGLIQLDHTTIAVLITAFGSPMAVSTVVMASEMNADDILAGQLVVWTSMLSMVTLFLQIVLFRLMGLM